MNEADVGALALELPWWGWVDEHTCLTRSGELLQVAELSPVVVDGRPAEELDVVTGRWQQMLSGLPAEVRVSWIVERRPPRFEPVVSASRIASLAQQKRQAFLRDRVQDVRVYVVWVCDAGLRQAGRSRHSQWWRRQLAEWRQRRRAPHESVYLKEAVRRAVKRAVNVIGSSAARVADLTPMRVLTADEAAAVFYRVVNGEAGEWVRGMRTDAGVNWRLAGVDVAAERELLRVGNAEFAVWSCVAPPSTVTANGLGDLWRVHAPLTVVMEWRPWSREAARRRLRSTRTHYFAKRFSLAAHVQEKEGTNLALEDVAASAESARAGAALVELETEGVGYGDVALSVTAHGTPEELDQWGAEIGRVFGALDAKITRESYGQLAVWFGRLPGQPASRQPRRVFVSAGVAACMAPVFGPPQGKRRCKHLGDVPALAVLETQAGTPYHFDLFAGADVGHTLMLGATGSGKSFLLNFLLVQALQYDPRVLILDLGGSYRALTQFLGGGYLEVSPEKSAIPLRPFGLEPTERRIQFLSAWVLRLLKIGGWEQQGGDLSEVRARIEDLYRLGRERRSLGNLVRSLPRKMWPALSRWHGAGAWGTWFDNPPVEDTDLVLADWQVIDLAGAVEHEDWCEAALLYLLERLRSEIESPVETTRLKLMVVDEAWRYLRDPVVLERLVEAAKTWRKRNAALVLATQSVSDLTASLEASASALLESMPSKVFLANPDFPASGKETFGLSDEEVRVIRELQPKQELLLRRSHASAILRLQVDPESYWLYTSSASEAAERAAAVERWGLEGAIQRLAAGVDRQMPAGA